MQGLMQDRPLLISSLLDHAERYHPEVEIVSRTCEGTVVCSSWARLAGRVRRMAQALRRLGVKPGDRIATLAWNTHRHFELFYGVGGKNKNLYEQSVFGRYSDGSTGAWDMRKYLIDMTHAGEQCRLKSAA